MIRLGLTIAAVSLATAVQPARAECTLGMMAELPVTMVELQPLVPAKINGVDAMFVADSGAFYSMISTASASQLHLRPSPISISGFRLKGVGGDAEASVVRVKAFTLASAAIPNVEFIVAAGVGGSSVGLLGQNVLHLADVEYNFANGMIRLFRPHGCGRTDLAYWAKDKPYSVLDIEYSDIRKPYTVARVMVNGVRLRAMFDTGAGTSVLTLAAARRAGLKTDGAGVKPAGFSHGIGRRSIPTWTAPVASFELADEKVTNTRMRIGDLELGDADMLIGADFFLSHRVFVANSQSKLYFSYDGGPVFNLSQIPPSTASTGPAKPGPPAPGADTASDPVDAEGFSRRGAALAARQQYDRAITDFTRAADLVPAEPRYLYQRAVARMRAKQPQLAVADLDRVLKLKPDDAQARLARAGLRFGSGDLSGSRADLDAAAQALPKEADLRLALAQQYLRADLLDLAIEQFDLWGSAHAGDGRMSAAMNGRCWARALAGRDLDRALSDCDTAQRLGLRTGETLDSRGMVHLRRGELDRAIADYNAALRLQPRLAWSLYGRGLAKLRKGLKAEGEADMAEAARIAPELPQRAKRLGIT